MQAKTAGFFRRMSESFARFFREPSAPLSAKSEKADGFDAAEFLRNHPELSAYRLVTREDIVAGASFESILLDLERDKWIACTGLHFCDPPIFWHPFMDSKKVSFRYFGSRGYTTNDETLEAILNGRHEVGRWSATIYVVREQDDALEDQGGRS